MLLTVSHGIGMVLFWPSRRETRSFDFWILELEPPLLYVIALSLFSFIFCSPIVLSRNVLLFFLQNNMPGGRLPQWQMLTFLGPERVIFRFCHSRYIHTHMLIQFHEASRH